MPLQEIRRKKEMELFFVFFKAELTMALLCLALAIAIIVKAKIKKRRITIRKGNYADYLALWQVSAGIMLLVVCIDDWYFLIVPTVAFTLATLSLVKGAR